ncbi:hypothetical protein B0H13DRAFT_1085470 [Mycena leptocephala]|nr:hypothetical protein B0H13DRAFT_1085470 [Mycena leptocephala]
MSLKERIAALKQREREERDPNFRASSPTPPAPGTGPAATASSSGGGAGALRAKIAQFESKGGVPVPRGSFGLGAPPDSAPKRRAELYGNRMQPARIPSATLGVAGLARPTSPFSGVDPRAVALPPTPAATASRRVLCLPLSLLRTTLILILIHTRTRTRTPPRLTTAAPA